MMYQPRKQVRKIAPRLSRSVLLQRHPVLVPLLLLGGSLLFGLAALVFSLLPGEFVVGFVTLCLSLACVLGIAGLLAGITGTLALLDRYGSSLLTSLLSRFKE